MRIILMGDIIGSSKRKGKALMDDFKKAVTHANITYAKNILSPLTITLGDEFQGVVRTPHTALQVIFGLEHYLLTLKKPFKMRYVLHEGEIETRLNKERAHEMLGPGLTEAREMLSNSKSARSRFHISLRDGDLSEKLNLMFGALQGIDDRWTPAQLKVVVSFLDLGDYKKVADRLRKDPTSIWRRKKSLLIEEFLSLKKLILKTIPDK